MRLGKPSLRYLLGIQAQFLYTNKAYLSGLLHFDKKSRPNTTRCFASF